MCRRYLLTPVDAARGVRGSTAGVHPGLLATRKSTARLTTISGFLQGTAPKVPRNKWDAQPWFDDRCCSCALLHGLVDLLLDSWTVASASGCLATLWVVTSQDCAVYVPQPVPLALLACLVHLPWAHCTFCAFAETVLVQKAKH